MEIEISVLLFFAFIATWTYLPFMPAVCELLELGDCEPVRVSPDSEVDIRHHARGYRESMNRQLAQPIARARSEGRPIEGHLADGTSYVVVPGTDDAPWPAERPGPSKTIILSVGALTLPNDAVYLSEISAVGPLRAGDRSVYRALLSDDRIALGAHSRSLRWIDAGTAVTAGEGSRLHGRVSSGDLIHLAEGCEFERMRAPRIVFGSEPPPPVGNDANTPLEAASLPGPVDVAGGRWLVRGRLDLPAKAQIEADLVVTGSARLGPGAHIQGSVKSRGDLHLGRNVVVDGSVVGGRRLFIEEGCRITGPVLAEESITIATGCRIGEPDHLTTLTARTMRIAPGCVVHGAVWAHEGGVVGREGDA